MGSDDDDHHHHLRKFGTRHKIMISAIFSLFIVVLVILFLHFYLRYLQRRRRQSRLISLEQQISRADRQNHTAAAAAPKAGLDPVLIARVLPESIHKQADHRGEIVECSICLSNIEEKAAVRILPNCKHIFHVECIDMWLFSNTTCPVCRTAVEPILTATNEHGEVPTAPPLVEEQSGSRFSSFRRTMSRERSQAVHATAPPLTEEQPSSRLSSFRRMMSRDRERSFRVHSCGEASVRSADLERQ
ncbi:E3 ubiquitin-protein ligase ATL41-like [Benincasa hispida]|uniref:E3 ubiquitin-protein ligase ATL41-like n=1 Tax=Benincasa hispida TaxID=102211 RepID=UPI001901C183|nr:E3 ubiquitin-protein ligase ATL41-like [Benincasa hispida]